MGPRAPVSAAAGWLRATAVDAASLPSMRGWFPVALDAETVGWRHLPGPFTEPFFSDSLLAQPLEERRVCLTSWDRLGDAGPALAPSLFLFHSSRCGSTLLAQMLATLPHCVVLSEPPAVDDFLRLHGDAGHVLAVPLLRWLVAALGQRRDAAHTHFVIKLDCWHMRHLPLFRAAFPATPCWFLYREPAAILASHRRQPGRQMVPGLVPGVLAQEEKVAPWDLERHAALVLRRIFGDALAHAGQLRLLDYRQLPQVVWESLLDELGIPASAQQREALQARARFHAKAVERVFDGDPVPHKAAAPHLPELLAMLAPLYARLEALNPG